MSEGTRVPPGHAVHAYGASADPGVTRTKGGVIVASFGFGGDDDDRELDAIVESTGAHLLGAPSAIRFAREAGHVSRLFAPFTLPPPVPGARVIWTARKDALREVLDEPDGVDAVMHALESLDAFHAFVVDDEWSAGPALLDRLTERGVPVLQAPPGAPFLMEVERPDGLIAAFVVGPHTITAPATTGPRQLVRAPRLHRVLVDLLAGRVDLDELHRELRDRTAPLLVFVRDGKLPTTTWPDQPPAIAAYGDLRSLLRAARETERAPDSYTVGGMMAPELLELSRENGGKLAIAVFTDDGVRYVTI